MKNFFLPFVILPHCLFPQSRHLISRKPGFTFYHYSVACISQHFIRMEFTVYTFFYLILSLNIIAYTVIHIVGYINSIFLLLLSHYNQNHHLPNIIQQIGHALVLMLRNHSLLCLESLLCYLQVLSHCSLEILNS